MERHRCGETRVIPIILRPCDWQSAPFGKLKALPTDSKPVTKHQTLDDAFLDITRAIREVIQQLGPAPPVVEHIDSTTGDTSKPSLSQRVRHLAGRQCFYTKWHPVFP